MPDPAVSPLSAPSPSFKWLMLPEARAQALDSARYLMTIAPDVAVRFVNRIEEEMDALCGRWQEGFRPLPDEAATLFFSHPVFVQTMRTGQSRRRRSNAGVWHLVYDAIDTDGDGAPDTLRVLSVRHSATRPLSIEDEDGA